MLCIRLLIFLFLFKTKETWKAKVEFYFLSLIEFWHDMTIFCIWVFICIDKNVILGFFHSVNVFKKSQFKLRCFLLWYCWWYINCWIFQRYFFIFSTIVSNGLRISRVWWKRKVCNAIDLMVVEKCLHIFSNFDFPKYS